MRKAAANNWWIERPVFNKTNQFKSVNLSESANQFSSPAQLLLLSVNSQRLMMFNCV